MRVLVCGGRDYKDREKVFATLDGIHCVTPIRVIIEGAADGADFLASRWAKDREVWNFRFPAQWKKYGRAAGPMRNREMLEKAKPDLVVAFPGGSGTANMVTLATNAGVSVMRIGL